MDLLKRALFVAAAIVLGTWLVDIFVLSHTHRRCVTAK